jgi:hypothetical protein
MFKEYIVGFAAIGCLALASGVAAASTCSILPYANQCQGANLWPTASGWTADNNGDCQPQPPNRVAATVTVAYDYYTNNLNFKAGSWEASCSLQMAAWGGNSMVVTPYDPPMENRRICTFMLGWQRFITQTRVANSTYLCPAGYEYNSPTAGVECGLVSPAMVRKPADGVCTARWTSSAMTALQTDPLDPDCDANSCVIDGVCALH